MDDLSHSQNSAPLIPADFFSRHGVQRLCVDAGLEPSKALGQNFLFQRSVLQAMVRDLDLEPDIGVIEVGCGFGHLTLTLVEAGYSVVAFETHRRRYECAARYSDSRLEVIHSDIRSCDLSRWLQGARRWVVVGNVPYSYAMSFRWRRVS